MARRAMCRLVIDASVAQSAGGEGAVNGVSKRCREFLVAAYDLAFRVAMTPEIAREWKMARGVTERDPRRDALEREAVMWRERREEVRLKAEEIRARFEKQKVKVDGALKIIGQKMLEEKGNLTAEGAIALIEDAFGAIGKIYNIDWREDGCNIWLEPWEERWSRSKEDELPVIYNLKINDRLEVVSIDAVEDEQSIAEQQAVLLERELKTGESLDEGPPGADEEDIKTRLEKKIAKAGRLIELKKWKEDAWVATVEPWEDMRLRNIERNGQGPIETETIVAKVVDGDLIMAPVKPELGTAQRPTGVPNSTERGRPKGVLRSEASPKGDDANVQKEGGEDAS